jgi:hypothetical protein
MPTRSGAEYLPLLSTMNAEPVPDVASDHGEGDLGGAQPLPHHDHTPIPVTQDALVGAPAGSGPGTSGAAAPSSGASDPLMRLSLPKDAIKLSKFKGDTDKSTVDDFLFQLQLFFDAQPHTYNGECCPGALKNRLVVLVGCFPTGSIAAVWFRTMYRRGVFTSYEEFVNLFTAQFQQSASDLVSLQARWEDARQLRNQSVGAYYAYLLQQQAAHAAIAWKHRPSEATLLTKFCASLRPDLKRFLQEKRIDHPNYTISQLVQAASVRESSTRSQITPNLNTMDASADSKSRRQYKCFFCRTDSHSHTECRKIAAKKKRGEWKERPAKN